MEFTMKRLILFVFMVVIFPFVFTSYSFSLPKTDVIVIAKKDGGMNGFNTVTETHYYREDCKCYWHELICKDPGYSACTWVTPPNAMRLISYAEDQISKGNLNGVYEEFFGAEKHVVEWNATDVYNANITETVYKEEGSQ